MIVSGFRAALELDTYPLSKLSPRCAELAKPCRGKAVLIMHIVALSLLFTPYLSNTVVSAKLPHFFHALVALKLLVSLISRTVACSLRIVVDR